MNAMSERDRRLLTQFNMSQTQVEQNAAQAENETTGDELTGRVYYGLHLHHDDEQMVNISLRMPKSDLDRITAEAKRYHISRSEYMRRQLTQTE